MWRSESMIITIDTERSSPQEIRKAVRVLVALEDSTEELRSVIRMLYDALASKVSEERKRYRERVRKRAREDLLKGSETSKKGQPGVARGGGMFQGVETGY